MKFVMNGGLLLGTVDGANVEIREEIGDSNLFMFGTLTADVEEQRRRLTEGHIKWDSRLLEVIQLLRDETFGEFPEIHQLLDSFTHHDHYLISVDWPSYLAAQELVDQTYKDEYKWTQMSILSAAGMGKFSADRSIQDYAEKIWKIEPHARPGPLPIDTSLMVEDMGKVGSYLSGASPGEQSPFTHDIARERITDDIVAKISRYSPLNSPSINFNQ